MQTNIIDRDEVKTQLEALANDVERCDKRAANRLRNLRTAVIGGNNADAWASTDIEKLISPEQIVENYKNRPMTDSLISALEWARNILIFMPLLISWLGISQAVSTYSTFVSAHQDQITQPFLYLWQAGFGGQLPSVYRLSSLAGIDAFLLFLLVVMTIVHSTLADLGRQRRIKGAEDLRADLAEALAGAALCLATRNRQQPTNVADAFDRSARFFGETVDKMLKRMEELARVQQQDHQTFANLSKDLQAIMSGVSTGVSDLKQSIDALRRSIGQLIAPVTKTSTTLEAVAAASQKLITLAEDQINKQQALLSEIQRWGNNLQSTLGKLDTAVNAAQLLASNIDRFTKRDEALHNVLTKELADQTNLTKAVVASTSNMGRFVSDLAQCLVEYKALNKELYTLAGRVAMLNKETFDLARRVAAMAH